MRQIKPWFSLLGITFLVACSASAELLTDGSFIIEPNPHSRVAFAFGEGEDLGHNAQVVRPFAEARTDGNSSTVRVVGIGDIQFCKSLIASGAVTSCSPNYQVRISATPNDPRFGELWGLQNNAGGANAQAAWDSTTGTQDVVVAVIDTGVDYNHQDLSANMWVNTGEIPSNGLDDDGNGYVDDIHGYNAVANNGNPFDDNAHGTHCAGTIGGRGNNGIGVAGINWQVKIMALKFLSATGSGSLSDAIEAINYMVTMKNRGVNVRVANNSWGGGGYSSTLASAISRANDAGIVFAAAAGNESNDNDASPSYPASYNYPNVVSVAAIDVNANLANFSNYGASSVDIAAPGVQILSTIPGNTYAKYSGTSMATPHVSGALALLFGAQPSLNVGQAITRMYETGSTLSTLNGVVRTSRKLNIARLISGESAPVPAPAEPACTYTTTTGVAADTSADDSSVVIQADEYGFHTVNLPFVLPFYGRSVSRVVVSPNGVVYMGNHSGDIDFQNGSTAPANSFAPLHSDLTTDGSGLGVRVYSSSSKVVIRWRAKNYALRSGNSVVDVRAVIRSSGALETHLTFSDGTIQSAVASAATIGLKDSSALGVATYASNSGLIRNGLGVRFTPSCGGSQPPPPSSSPNATVRSVTISGLSGSSRTRSIKPKGTIALDIAGEGTGSMSVRIGIDGISCGASSRTLTNGQLSLALGATTLRFRDIGVRVTAGNSSASASGRVSGVKKRLSRRDAIRACGQLMSSVRRIRARS